MSYVSEEPLAPLWSRAAPRVTERETDYEKSLRVACGTLRHSTPSLIPGVTVVLHAETWEEVEEIVDRAHDLAEEYELVATVVPYERHAKVRFSRAAGSGPAEDRR